jgi:hydrogenase maturation protease
MCDAFPEAAPGPRLSGGLLVIGLGNRYRGDDAAGLRAAERLRDLTPPDIAVVTHEGEPIDLLDRWRNAQTVVLIDAIVSGAAPGTVRRLDVRDAPLPVPALGDSTHAVSLAAAIELARALDHLPAHLIVYGIEATAFTAGADLSPAVHRAVEEVVESLRRELTAASGALPPSAIRLHP